MLFLEILTSVAPESLRPIELFATKATNSMGWIFLDILGTAFRTAWMPTYQKKDTNCDDAQDKGAGDNPDHRIHILTET
jgi:hypothetical protein